MAITLVGTAANNAINGGDVTVTLPVGTAQGDVVIAAYGIGSEGGPDHDMVTVTSGYTQLADLFSDDSFEAQLGVFRKIQGSTPDTTVVFDGNGVADDAAAGAVMVTSGVNQTTPEDATTTTVTGINGPTPDPSAITTGTANARVIAIASSTEADVPTAPTNYTDLIEDQGVDNSSISIMMAWRLIVAPGAENPGTFGGIVGSTSDAWAAATVALRPAPAAAGRVHGYVF